MIRLGWSATLNFLLMEGNTAVSPETTTDIPHSLNHRPNISLCLTSGFFLFFVVFIFFLLFLFLVLKRNMCKNKILNKQNYWNETYHYLLLDNIVPFVKLWNVSLFSFYTPRRKEPAVKQLFISPWSYMTSHQWSCSSTGEPTRMLPCLMAAPPSTWQLGDRMLP